MNRQPDKFAGTCVRDYWSRVILRGLRPVTTPYVEPSTNTRVLLVEKDRIVRELLEVTLAHTGRQLIAATTFAEGLDFARRYSPLDVVLVEASLADGSGFELLRCLRSIDSTTELLLMSAAPSLDSVLAAVEAGAADYFPKPFEDINQLALRVAAAEERSRLRRDGQWLHNALVESEERYRKLFAATPDALIVFDERTHLIEEVNPAALDLYGYDRDELVGRPVEQLRSAQAETVHVGPTGGAGNALRDYGALLRSDTRRDGAVIEVELVVGRFHVKGQNKVVEIIRDIGERLQQQRERAELENQLRQSQKLEALGQLAGGVAHDFNNLLVVILNYAHFVAENLRQMPADGQVVSLLDDVEQILRASTSATALTRQLLAFSRQELVQPEVLEIKDVVRATERLLRGSLGPNVELVTELESSPCCVRIDRGQLEQVIVNLVVNARDAMPRGGTLTIATRKACASGSGPAETPRQPAAIELSVRDSGDGIEAAVLEKIFEPFFTTKGRERGTGLGLAMVKGIVEHAGGKIEVATEVGKGSRFCITLPGTAEAAELKPRSKAPSRRPQSGELIMVVDDDVAVRKALGRILKSAGYRVVLAENGQQALAEHESLGMNVDLVITDILMPGQTGEELAAELRKRQPELRIVFTSGYAAIPVVEGGGTREQRTVLPKPFDQARLLEVIHGVLDLGGTATHKSNSAPQCERS